MDALVAFWAPTTSDERLATQRGSLLEMSTADTSTSLDTVRGCRDGIGLYLGKEKERGRQMQWAPKGSSSSPCTRTRLRLHY